MRDAGDPVVRARFGLRIPASDLWVFGYGSLMWSPGFPHAHSERAVLHGYHRSFCIWSARYRGTPGLPGLVLGLDHGGSCCGMAFRVAAVDVHATLDALWEREMSRDTYRPKLLAVDTPSGRVRSLAFVTDRRRSQYARSLSPRAQAERIAAACGQRGSNVEYLENTVAHLDALGVRDEGCHCVLDIVHELRAARRGRVTIGA